MSATVAAVFNAADANHDGVITQAEFATAMAGSTIVTGSAAMPAAPVVYSTGGVTTTAPVYYTAPPVYVTATEGYAMEEPPIVYAGGEPPIVYTGAAPLAYPGAYTTTSPMTYVTAPAPAMDTYQPGERITYQSVTTGQSYPGAVVDMYTDGGCQIVLDVDGGVKDLFLQDMGRLSRETAAPAAAEAAAPAVKSKKAKKVKSNKKGCC